MNTWRVIITDSECLSGVAPTCENVRPDGEHGMHHVLDCCPGPHIECWNEQAAKLVARALTEAEAEVCP